MRALTVPKLCDGGLSCEYEIKVQTHKEPADSDGNGTLDPALLALLGSSLRVHNIIVLGFVVAVYSGRKCGGVCAGPEQTVRQRQGDDSSNCE